MAQNYHMRKTRASDIDNIDIMIAKAKKNMRDVLRIDQWQSGYPNREIYLEDIELGISYVICDEDDNAVGVAAVTFEGEPLYDVISDNSGEFPGKWQDEDGRYTTVHRVCVDLDITCRGVGAQFMEYIFDLSRKCGMSSVRIDTHRYNIPMRTLLKKCGYRETGVIYIPEPHTNERITYEKLL